MTNMSQLDGKFRKKSKSEEMDKTYTLSQVIMQH